MIVLEAVAARRAPLSLAKVSCSWGPGAHAVVGTSADGGPLLLELVAGRARLRSGRLEVLGGSPHDDDVRTRVAFVPVEPDLPEAMRVSDVMALAAELRGEPARDAAPRLSALGVEALAPRRVASLSLEEGHAVALAEALTASHVRVLLLVEPLLDLDPRAAARVAPLVRARAAEGCTVLVATASLRDAGELADDHALLRAGTVVRSAASPADLVNRVPTGAKVRVVASDPPALLAAAARDPAIEAIARRDGAVVARGRDVLDVAAAMARAITASGVRVVEITLEPPSPEELRAAPAPPERAQ
jgi:ABC-2 type transport system ATP-binding protein